MHTTEHPAAPHTSMTHNRKRLLKRGRTILFEEKRGVGRISRGEYWVSSLLLTVLLSAAMILTLVGPWMISFVIGSLIGLAQFGISLGYIKRRCQDLGRSFWFFLRPLLAIVGLVLLVILFAVMLPAQSDTALSMLMYASIAVFAAVLIWTLVVGVYLLFVVGTKGPNTYGADPLHHQPKTNALYWYVCIALVIANAIVSGITEQNPNSVSGQYVLQYLQQQGLLPQMMPNMMDLPQEGNEPADREALEGILKDALNNNPDGTLSEADQQAMLQKIQDQIKSPGE